ncbi:hypothetical protein D4T95_11005 [Salmonella enterica subsp. enterica serovar Infantis]|nr:hypothetical protein [Salmonella enterica subsp. enterica serovar Infantis]
MRQHKYSPVLQAFTTCTSEQHFKNGKLLVFIKRRYGIIKDNQSRVFWALLQIVGGDKLIIPFC